MSIEVRPYEIPLRMGWGDAVRGPRTRRGFLLRDAEFAGEAALVPEAADAGLEKLHGSLLRAAEARAVPSEGPARHAWRELELWRQSEDEHHSFATILGRPVERRPRRTVKVNATLPIDTTTRTVGTVDLLRRSGYGTFKLKIGPGEEEVARVQAVRDAVGSKIRLRIDPNGAWDAATAKRRLAAFRKSDPEFVEQPIAPGHLDAFARLAKSSPAPLAPDEDARTPVQAKALLDRGGFPFLILKPMLLGGPDAAAELVVECEENDVVPIVTDVAETGVGRAAALAVAALTTEVSHAHGLGSGIYLQHDLVRPALVPEDGALHVPTRRGLGVTLTQER